jgi:fructokinase
MVRFAAIEGGGTKWIAAIAENDPTNLIEKVEFETLPSPHETLTNIKLWLLQRQFDSIGIASFGPIDAKPTSSTYGYITSTPKPGWRDTNVLQLLGIYDEFKGIPFLFDTDVNAPAIAEYTYYQKLHPNSMVTSSAYITVGTGVGVGLVANNLSVKGLLHPEAGHISVRACPGDELFQGSCPFHGTCIEGMCSIGALAKRLNISKRDLPAVADDHVIWNYTAYYIAQLCANLTLIASPERISIGGGVLKRASLFPKIRTHYLQIINGYIQHPKLTIEDIDSYITEPLW